MPKLSKLLAFTCLSFLLCFQAIAWEELLEYEGSSFTGLLEYDRSQQEVRLKYRRVGNWGRFKVEGPFKVGSPTSVEESINTLNSFLQRQVFASKTINNILSRIEEFKYLSNVECQALHFSLQNSEAADPISALIHEVEKIRLAQNPGVEAFRSQLVREFNTELEGKIQLRMVLDRNGDFLKFSFAKEEGDLTKLNWSQHQGIVTLLNERGQTILELDLRSFESAGGLVIVRHPRRRGLENNERSYFRFTKENQKWQIYPYSTEHFTETVIKDGVALTSGTADHTPVIQLNGSEIAFARLDLQTLQEDRMFDSLKGHDVRKIEGFYNHCMGERLSFLFEEEKLGFNRSENTDSDQAQSCKRIAEIEGLYISLNGDAVENGLPNDSKEAIIKTVKDCLIENGLAVEEGDFFSFKYSSFLESTNEDFEAKRNTCFHAGKRSLVLHKIKKSVFESRDIAEQIKNERTIQILWSSVKGSVERDCLDTVVTENLESCHEYSNILVNENLFLAQVSTHLSNLYEGDNALYGEKRLELIQSYQSCRNIGSPKIIEAVRTGNLLGEMLDTIKNEELGCAQEATLNLSSMNSARTFERTIERMGLDRPMVLSNELSTDANNIFRNCIKERMQDEGDLTRLISSISYYQESCLTNSLLPLVSKNLHQSFKDLLNKYSFIMSPGDILKVEEDGQRIIARELELWSEIDGLSERIDAIQVPLFAKVLENHVLALKNELELSEDKASFESSLNALFNDGSSRPFALKIKNYLRDILRMSQRSDRTQQEYLTVAMNDFLKEAHKVSFALKTHEEVSSQVLLESDAAEIKDRVSGIYQPCLDEYSPNRSQPLSANILLCEKKRLAKVALELTRRRMERLVSSHFPILSEKANSILSPIQYLDLCFEKVDTFGSKTKQEYIDLIEGCQRVAELDISYNISNAKVDGYRPLLSAKGYRDSVTAYCYNIIFNHVSGTGSSVPRRSDISGSYRDLTKMQQSQRSRSPYEGSLLRFFLESSSVEPEFAESDHQNILGLVQTFANDKNFTQDWWGDKLANCEKGTDDFINVRFRDYVIESIPALSFSDSDDSNASLMRDFLDYDLVEGLLAYKKAFEEKEGSASFGVGSVVPTERSINPELGITSLTNFIHMLGGFLSRGFIYDEAAMRTELIVFQSELKAFLNWSKENPDRLSIADAMAFFTQSKLAEHLALAEISEKTHKNFQNGLTEMKLEELDEFFGGVNCRFISCLNEEQKTAHDSIISKYRKLLELTKEMTSSYDFRRIISPESNSGEQLINRIKETILVPEIIGQGVTATAEAEVMGLIGQAILRDNTDGGFAERFVEVAAQSILDKERGDRWGVTRYLFFDNSDFDWNTLKQTEAGERAINYYARFVMLPRFLGQTQTEYLKQTRLEQFRRLLTEAQGQNDD